MVNNLLAVAFSIFGLEVRYYGLIIVIGIAVAFYVVTWIFKKIRYKENLTFEILLVTVPLAIICSRLWFCVNESVPLSQIFDFWRGGMTIHGAMLGGALGLLIYTRFVKKSSFFALTDVVVIALILAQSIGRWGNFFNAELFGPAVDFHFFPITVDIHGEAHLALFFYESILNLAGFFVLLNIFSRQKKIGTTSASYLIFYGAVRAVLEPIRYSPYIMRIPGTGIPTSILFSVLMVVGGIVILILNKYNVFKNDDSAYIDNTLTDETAPDAEDDKKGKPKPGSGAKNGKEVKASETDSKKDELDIVKEPDSAVFDDSDIDTKADTTALSEVQTDKSTVFSKSVSVKKTVRSKKKSSHNKKPLSKKRGGSVGSGSKR